jgi:hypothetical protein
VVAEQHQVGSTTPVSQLTPPGRFGTDLKGAPDGATIGRVDDRGATGGEPPSGPLRISRLTVHAHTAGRALHPLDDARHEQGFDPDEVTEVDIVAELASPCPRDEWKWWMEQLRPWARTAGGVFSGEGMLDIRIRVAPADVEVKARALLAGVAELAAGYPENFEEWRRQRDGERAQDRRRQEEKNAPYQAVLDRVFNEHRSR